MSPSYDYAIARLEANPSRGERLNVAIVVFDANGLTVHSGRNLEKVRAITSALDRSVIEQALANLPVLDLNLRDGESLPLSERLTGLNSLSAVMLSEPGRFFAPDADAYDATIQRLLLQLVEPEPAPAKKPKQKKSRLLTAVKTAFRAEKILARKGENLDSHRVVLNEQLAEGLNADMLLKNGAMHVVQTVDASHSERAKGAIQDIGISALIFEQARIKFGPAHTKPRLVYSASTQLEYAIAPALHAAEHQGADLINWESRDDRTRFVVDMSSLAEPAESQKRVDFGAVVASTRKNLH
jgi:hypothetical protein